MQPLAVQGNKDKKHGGPLAVHHWHRLYNVKYQGDYELLILGNVEDNCCGLKASVRIIGTRTYI
jgi:hypothetical protein